MRPKKENPFPIRFYDVGGGQMSLGGFPLLVASRIFPSPRVPLQFSAARNKIFLVKFAECPPPTRLSKDKTDEV